MPPQVSEEELIRAFSSGDAQPELAGAVEAVRVVRDPKTNIGKGIAYVLFK
jgi:nucleolar protein 12